jgi:hypothetical protein
MNPGVLLFAAGVLLLLHHCWKHARENPETSHAQQESCPAVCYFQLSDVGNFRTCNHEMWVLVFFFLAGCSWVWEWDVEI